MTHVKAYLEMPRHQAILLYQMMGRSLDAECGSINLTLKLPLDWEALHALGQCVDVGGSIVADAEITIRDDTPVKLDETIAKAHLTAVPIPWSE